MRSRFFNILFAAGRTSQSAALTIVFLVRFALADHRKRPRIFRRYLEACSGAYIKVGQLLAMRYDLLPGAYCQELAHLLNRVSPIESDQFKKLLATGLGHSLKTVFSRVETTPLGSASIAQVHGAILLGGQQVAVKVMRPDARRKFQVDLRNMRRIAWAVDTLGIFGASNFEALAEELARITLIELDFIREARGMQMIHENMRRDNVAHRSPAVHLKLCTPTVIVMERLQGVSMIELLKAVHDDDQEAWAQFAERGIDRKRLARTIVESLFEQAFVHRLMHADPHAGNLIVLDGGILGYLDFGIVAHLDEQTWAQQRKLFEAMAHESVHEAYEAIVATFTRLPAVGLSRMESEIKDLVWMWITAMRTNVGTIAELSNGRLILDVANVARRYGVELPWRFLVFHRSTLMSDTIVLSLDSKLDSMALLRDLFERDAIARLLKALCPEEVAKAAAASYAISVALPAVALETLEWFKIRWPELRREYSHELTRFRLGTVRFLHGMRMLCYLLATLIGIGRITAAGWSVPPSPSQEIFLDWWWAGLIASTVCGVLAARTVAAVRNT